MFNFFSQKDAQLITLTNREMSLYVWENKSLRFVSEFDVSSQSLEAFKQVQSSLKELPAIIITNFLEESFRSESIAPVSGNDRKALLTRKLNYAFRKTSFRTASIIEREKEGRRDHRVLLSGLTKPDLLIPWIKVLLDNKTPIQSVSSAAYLAEAFAKNAGFDKEGYVLIASLENDYELRQTFMKSGKILFSRLTTLSSRDEVNLGREVYKESVQIRSYLERVKLLPYEETLKIRLYSGYDEEDLKLSQKSSHLNHFECVNIHNEFAQYKTQMKPQQQGAMVYFLCNLIQKKQIKNTYAQPRVRKFFLLDTIGSMLAYGSLAVIVVSLLFSMPLYLEAWNLSNQQTDIASQTQPLEVEYNVLTQRFPETPIPSKEMALVVESFEQIDSQIYSPIQAMAYISENIASSPNLQITEIEWSLQPYNVDPALPENQTMRYLRYQTDQINSYLAAILDHRTTLRVEISGVAFSSGSYREAQQQVQVFSDALAQNPGVRVVPVRMPTDVRVDNQVSTTIDNNELRAQFVLRLNIESL